MAQAISFARRNSYRIGTMRLREERKFACDSRRNCTSATTSLRRLLGNEFNQMNSERFKHTSDDETHGSWLHPAVGVLTIALSTILGGCGGSSIDERQLHGSWEVETRSSSTAIVFTFNPDHTWSLTIPDRLANFAVQGDWRLEGNQLVSVMRGGTNEFTSVVFPDLPSNAATNRILTLNETTMIWQGLGAFGEARLKRVKSEAIRQKPDP